MTHRIRRQILELELPREEGARALQQRAGRLFQEKVLPALDAHFSQLAPADHIVRLDRLEIDLGHLGETNWEQRFVERCVEQISLQVSEAVAGKGENPATVQLDPAENAWQIFLHFLDSGTFPWYARDLSIRDLENLLDTAIRKRADLLKNHLLPVLKQNPAALRRFVWQFRPAFSAGVIEAAFGFSPDWIEKVVLLRQQQTGQPVKATERAAIVQKLVEFSNLQKAPNLPEPSLLEAWFYAGKAEDHNAIQGRPNKEKYDEPDHAAPQNTDADIPDIGARPTKTQDFRPGGSKPAPAQSLVEGLFVDNAGIVLFAPYLPAFFNHLELTDGPTFKNESAQIRALHLLNFLACGSDQPEEQLLPLSKLLCGISFDTPVPKELELTALEKTEAEQLLEAVIRNWPALKNSGPDGLRQAFIRRNGHLAWQESRQSWLLRVERLGHDILLDRLPWTISVVKLPWMDEMVQVEW